MVFLFTDWCSCELLFFWVIMFINRIYTFAVCDDVCDDNSHSKWCVWGVDIGGGGGVGTEVCRVEKGGVSKLQG